VIVKPVNDTLRVRNLKPTECLIAGMLASAESCINAFQLVLIA
jgi:hypothetical protein